ncbi:hypothetical protein ACJ41O_004746 [Fusarium nematophilum]
MPNPLRASYHFLTSALDQDQVPSEIRRSLEFVRTCEQDLQLLIELRNEHLPLLEQQPRALERVHSIIEAAQSGLAEVCELVERCRPEAHRGRTPLTSRMAWFLVDADDFRSHEFVISQHHNTVLAELNYLRNMALIASVTDPPVMGAKKEKAVFDNLGLLGDILGDMSGKYKQLLESCWNPSNTAFCYSVDKQPAPSTAYANSQPEPGGYAPAYPFQWTSRLSRVQSLFLVARRPLASLVRTRSPPHQLEQHLAQETTHLE